MNALSALAKKDLKLLFRDKFGLFWIFAFPLMFALFFGAIFGSDDGEGRGALSLTIVDEDESEVSRAIVRRLDENESVRLTRLAPEGRAEGDGGLEALDLAAAREAVQKGKRTAYLRIPAGYGENPYAVFGAGGDDQPTLEIGIDPGRRAEAGFLQGVLMEAMFGALQDRLTDREELQQDLSKARQEVAAATDLDGQQKFVLQTFLSAVDLFVGQFDMQTLGPDDEEGSAGGTSGFGAPFEVVDVTRDTSKRPRSTFDVSFPQALVWGLMSVAMSFAISLVRERGTGALLRLRVAPIGRAELLGGKALACFLGCMLTMAAILLFGVIALGVQIDSVPLLVLAMSATAVCFTGLMMTISIMGKTEPAVAGSSWGLMMPFAMIGGGMIPLIAMPDWLQKASVVSPFKWAITSIEGAIWRGFDLGDMLLPCSVLVAIGVLFFAFGVFVFRRTES